MAEEQHDMYELLFKHFVGSWCIAKEGFVVAVTCNVSSYAFRFVAVPESKTLCELSVRLSVCLSGCACHYVNVVLRDKSYHVIVQNPFELICPS
jgi:hypothetical protein